MAPSQRQNPLGEDMAGPEFPEYAISYSRIARDLRNELTEKLRVTLLEIVDELAENPDKYPSRLIQKDEKTFIYKHPHPAIEITYRLDRERKVLSVLHVVAPALETPKRLFISYSHKDEKWLLELKIWLKPLEERDIVTIWDDQTIKAGADWHHAINEALASAKAAILLVSMDFLNSDFIKKNELPELLNAARQEGLAILWIAVRPSAVDDSPIANYQALHKDPPLALLKKAQREEQFQRMYKRIKEVVGV